MAVCWGIGQVRRGSAREDPLPAGVSPRDYELARESFEAKYGRKAERIDVVSWLAEWYLFRERLTEAVECFKAIPTSHPQYGRMARYQQGRTLLSLHRAVEAEQQFQELIRLEEASATIKPEYLIDARQRLRHILETELRFEERQQLLRGVIARGEADNFELMAYCFPTLLRWNGPGAMQWFDQFRKMSPDDRLLRIAHGRYLTGQGELDEARKVIEDVLREWPDDLSALASLLACLREADDVDELSRRMATLPVQSAQDPWLLLVQRGQYANQNGQPEVASSAFTQLLSQDRTCTEAWAGLAQAALLLNDVSKQNQALKMAAGLSRIQNRLGKITRSPDQPDSFLDVAELCAELALNREGRLFTGYARQLSPKNPRVLTVIKMLQSGSTDTEEMPP